ncbi:MAG: acyltransferase [Ferruginibacter sp.]|nr:acyltransferase [Ferruginibacter sp.]
MQKKLHFPNLDGFRTIAFLIVYFGHCYILFDFGSIPFVIKYIGKIFSSPGIGVHFFFVLSGFLISYLLLTELNNYSKINITAFYMRRVLRIWPVYFLVIIISLLLSFINKPFYSLHDANFWQIGLFLTNFNLANSNILWQVGISSLPITVLWSVAVEEQFYLILPLLIYFFSKKVFYFFPIFIIISLIFGIVNANNIIYAEFSTLGVCGSLFVGCIIAYLTLNHNFASIFNNLKASTIKIVYIFFLVLHIYREKVFGTSNGNALLYFIYALFFAFFIMEQNFSKNSFYKMSNFKWLTQTGKYTYGLYAYHMIFISLAMIFVPNYINPVGNYFTYFFLWAIVLFFTYIFAKFSYNNMEKPFLKLKEKFNR